MCAFDPFDRRGFESHSEPQKTKEPPFDRKVTRDPVRRDFIIWYEKVKKTVRDSAASTGKGRRRELWYAHNTNSTQYLELDNRDFWSINTSMPFEARWFQTFVNRHIGY